MDNHEAPIRPAGSGSAPDDGGIAVAPTPHTLPCSLLLHLGPGLVVGAAYLALIPAARALGLPSAAAIGAQAILVTGPLMIGILMVSRRRRPEEPAIALRRVPTVAATLGWAAVILGAAAAAFVLTRPVTAWLERTLFQAWPLAHAVLFAFYHVWTLWLTPTRILAVLPLIYITLRTRSILPAMVAHVVLNLIDVVLIMAVVIRPG